MEGDKKRNGGGGGEHEDPATSSTPTLAGSPGSHHPGQGDGGGASTSSSSTTTDDGGEHLEESGGSPRSVDEPALEEVGGGMNPLMDPVILAHLFNILPPATLATSRLVCSTWGDLSVLAWRSKAALKIYCEGWMRRDGYEVEYFLLKGGQRTSLGQFMDFWEANCLVKPYRIFHLERWRFGEEGENVAGAVGVGPGADVTRFWQGVGSQMTKLTLDTCSSSNIEHFMNVVIQSCPNLETLILKDFTIHDNNIFRDDDEVDPVPPTSNPVHEELLNLRSLQLIITRIRRRQHPGVLRVTYTRLLSHFPNLSTIEVSCDPYQQQPEILELLRAVKEVRAEGPQMLPIKELATDFPLELSSALLPGDYVDDGAQEHGRFREGTGTMIMRLLIELHIRIPIKSFRLTDNWNEIDTQKLIEISAETLTELTVYMHSSPRRDFPFGVHLENLRSLTMSEGFCRTLELLFYTPNLETLCIQDDARFRYQEANLRNMTRPRGMETNLISNSFKPDMEDVELLKLSSLTIEFGVRDYDLRWLVRWMPHVRNLCMFLDDGKFAIACEKWEDLVSLTVLGDRLTDAGVTGMMTVMGKAMVIHSNVTSLQKLEEFKAQDSTLTSASLYHGFLELDALRRVWFEKAEQLEVAAKEALLQKNVQLRDF